jgi:hypothetical protein
MALHDVSPHSVAGGKCTFQVDRGARSSPSQRRASEGLGGEIHRKAGCIELNDGEAGTVHRDTVPEFSVREDQPGFQDESVVVQAGNPADLFNDSSEH